MKPKTKGLEPIVAAVLLIVIAVIGAVLVYLWFTGYVTKAISQADQITAAEKLKIEAASLIKQPNDAKVILYVRNLANSPVELSTLYILKAATNTVACEPKQLTQTDYTVSGDLITVDTTVQNCAINLGHYYTIKLVTAQGTEVATTVKPSQ